MGADDDLALLTRHRPLLRYDRQYDYRTASVNGAVENPGNVLRRGDGEVIGRVGAEPPLTLGLLSGYPEGLTARDDDCIAMAPDVLGDTRRMEGEERYDGRFYGHVVNDGERTWLQYWFWLYYNPKNLFGFGKHEGDWEMVQIGLDAAREPELVAYSQHNSGEARRFAEVETVEREGSVHPIVYIASLSHACYFEPGTHVYSAIGIDHAYGDGPEALLPVELPGPWAEWPGRWGSSEHVIAGRLGNGPPSPARQRKWDDPAGFQAGLRRRAVLRLARGALHRIGEATFPPPPSIEARQEGRRCMIDYRLRSEPRRRSRHLYLTVHTGERVIASRAMRRPPPSGREVLLLPAGIEPTGVCASAFNRLRQRSSVTEVGL